MVLVVSVFTILTIVGGFACYLALAVNGFGTKLTERNHRHLGDPEPVMDRMTVEQSESYCRWVTVSTVLAALSMTLPGTIDGVQQDAEVPGIFVTHTLDGRVTVHDVLHGRVKGTLPRHETLGRSDDSSVLAKYTLPVRSMSVWCTHSNDGRYIGVG